MALVTIVAIGARETRLGLILTAATTRKFIARRVDGLSERDGGYTRVSGLLRATSSDFR